MGDHKDARKWMSAWTMVFVIGAGGAAVSASPPAAFTVTYRSNELGMEFVMIPPGEFQMGCSEGAKPNECSKDEKPRHSEQITKPFEIGKTELAQKHWQALVGSDPSIFKGEDLPLERVT